MKTRDILEETFSALKSNKVRTGLTMLGIVIGIASVIAMVAIGQGASNSVSSQIESMGANLIMVSPGAQRTFGGARESRGGAKTLTIEDAEKILSQVDNVSAVAKVVSSQQQVVSTGTNTNTSILGTESSYSTIRSIEIAEGNFITDQQVEKTSKVAVLGSTTRDDLFGEDETDVVGEKIRINGVEYKVIGIAAEKGGSGMTSSDDVVYIPYTTAQRYLTGNKYLTGIYISAESSEVSTTVQDDIETLLLNLHGIESSDDADFSIMNQSDMLETASDVTGTFTVLLAAIAGISLLVGGIGIMNMMLTTVTERTREIGLRKAIGARKRDISLQFLTEATVLTFLGGILGVVFGAIVSIGLNYFDVTETQVSISSVLLAFGVSALIGIVFGYYPAKRAANLNPIDALRYE